MDGNGKWRGTNSVYVMGDRWWLQHGTAAVIPITCDVVKSGERSKQKKNVAAAATVAAAGHRGCGGSVLVGCGGVGGTMREEEDECS